MTELLSSPYLLLCVLLALFLGSAWLRMRTGWVLFNPTLLTTIGMIAFLLVLDIDYAHFERAGRFVSFWLQFAVVALAVPLYLQWQKIKSQWLAVLVAQLIGSVVGIVTGVGLVRLLGGSELTALSIAAKSVTTPIAIGITENLGGAIGITAGAVMVAGVAGQMVGLALFRWIGLSQPMSQGLAMGTGSHALGISELAPRSERYVAYGTVGLIINGILTAIFAPVLVPWLLSLNL